MYFIIHRVYIFMNNINGYKYKSFLVLLFLILTFITISLISYTKAVSSDLSSNLFRLHVIANSDSEEDQNLKYKVRDSLIDYMNSLCINLSNKNEVIKTAKSHLNDFKQIAQNTVYENGFEYNIDVEIGNFDFPTKVYGDIELPSGYYDALKVKIGNASGQNWWCVMFPPLCFVDVSTGIVPDESKYTLQNNLSNEDYSLINYNNSNNNITEFKFKLIEIINNFAIKITNK